MRCKSAMRCIRNVPSTAGNSMGSSERPSLEPILKKEASPAVLGGGENSGNALEASNALNYRIWGIPAVLSRGIPGNALRAFPGSVRNFSGISSGKSQPYLGCGPMHFCSPRCESRDVRARDGTETGDLCSAMCIAETTFAMRCISIAEIHCDVGCDGSNAARATMW